MSEIFLDKMNNFINFIKLSHANDFNETKKKFIKISEGNIAYMTNYKTELVKLRKSEIIEIENYKKHIDTYIDFYCIISLFERNLKELNNVYDFTLIDFDRNYTDTIYIIKTNNIFYAIPKLKKMFKYMETDFGSEIEHYGLLDFKNVKMVKEKTKEIKIYA